jgi:hypothetical protein
MGTFRQAILVLALLSACADENTQGPPRDASTSPSTHVMEAGTPGPEMEVAREGTDGGGAFRLPAIDLSKLDADAISQLQGVYLVKNINGYLIVCWEDGRVQIKTPRGETCSKNVGVTGRSANVQVRMQSSPDDAVIAVHAVVLVRDGACVP